MQDIIENQKNLIDLVEARSRGDKTMIKQQQRNILLLHKNVKIAK